MAEPKLLEAIGPYRIQSTLGKGGMGTVYRAVHDTLERPVALKILPPEFADNPEYVTRFLREARVSATLRHDNIVQVYDAGEENGKYFIAMELVEGTSLGQHLDSVKMLDEKEGLELLHQAAKGLAAAHEKELVHRDIKPDNLLLDKDMRVHIVDFGLVMESASNTQLTATGSCLGTPLYMSPEQVDGEKADGRSDLYSLGVTFYRAFTGQAPFQSQSMMNLMYKHRFEAPKDPRELRPELSLNLSHLLLWLMGKRREDRPQSALDLVELIEDMRKGKKIPPPPAFQTPDAEGTMIEVQPTGRIPPWRRLTPGVKLALAAGGVAGAILLVALGALFFGRSSEGSNGQKPDGASAIATAGLPGTSKTEALPPSQHTSKTTAAEPTQPKNPENPATVVRDPGGKIKKPPPPAGVKRHAAPKVNPAEQKAQEEEAKGRFIEAARMYDTLAMLTEDEAQKKRYRQSAAGCRHKHFIREGDLARARRDWEAAAGQYGRALAIRADDPARQKLRVEMLRKAKEENDYRGYIQTGDLALKGKKFSMASANYRLALRIHPENKGLQEKLKEVKSRGLMAEGDQARQRGDFASARRKYGEALEAHPKLVLEVTSKLAELDRRTKLPPFDMEGLRRAVEALVRGNRTREAVLKVSAARRARPNHIELFQLEKALASLQKIKRIYEGGGGLPAILDSALDDQDEAHDLDRKDSEAKQWKRDFSSMNREARDNNNRASTDFLTRRYRALEGHVGSARKLAARVTRKLSAAQDHCDEKAQKDEKGRGVSIFGIVKVGVHRKERARKYRRLADDFGRLKKKAESLTR